MKFVDFERHAAASLISSQGDDGSWGNNPATTCAAMEALLEIANGPDPLCMESWLYRRTHPDAKHIGWLMLSYGIPSGKGFNVYDGMEAVTRGYASFRSHSKHATFNPWLAIRRLKLLRITDPDFWIYVGEQERLRKYESDQPWLLAQLGLTLAHFDPPYEFGSASDSLDERRQTLGYVHEISGMGSDGHWTSTTAGPQETTAIVLTFLFHSCITRLAQDLGESVPEIRKASSSVQWLLEQQNTNGLWDGSPHVTAHAIRSLVAATECDLVPAPVRAASKQAIGVAARALLSQEVIGKWDALSDYKAIDVLSALSWLFRSETLDRSLFDHIDVTTTAIHPRAFLSYGGCDSPFAQQLARDLEDRGVHVWFAEWDLDYGDDIVQEIQRGLESTRQFLVILSPEAIGRPWVRQELSVAFMQALDGPGREIIPIMYKKCKPPAFVGTRKWIDATYEHQYSTMVDELSRRLLGKPRKRR